MPNKWDPVAYSAATRDSIAKTEEQIRLTQEYLEKMGGVDTARRIGEYAKIVGLAITLVNLAERHRQWKDAERFQAIQGHYAMLLGDLEHNVRVAYVDQPLRQPHTGDPDYSRDHVG